jgi:hypothetical protein
MNFSLFLIEKTHSNYVKIINSINQKKLNFGIFSMEKINLKLYDLLFLRI